MKKFIKNMLAMIKKLSNRYDSAVNSYDSELKPCGLFVTHNGRVVLHTYNPRYANERRDAIKDIVESGRVEVVPAFMA